MLTIFTTPKSFVDPHISMIQRNAIRSWKNLGDQVDVLLIGAEPGTAEVAAELRVKHRDDVLTNQLGTPLISSIFSLARQSSESPVLTYVNADIILLPDLPAAARTVLDQFEQFLIVGQRWDLDIRRDLAFGPGWAEALQAEVRSRGRLHPPTGSDYFIFPRDSYIDLPDFAIGRAGWDNWMIYKARNSNWPTIDATKTITVIHQDHDYSHLPGGQPHYRLPESDENIAMAGGKKHMYYLIDTNLELVDGIIHPIPFSFTHLVRQVELWIMPNAVKPRGLRGWVALRLRRLRRGLVRRSSRSPS